jgi:hypothetical protein
LRNLLFLILVVILGLQIGKDIKLNNSEKELFSNVKTILVNQVQQNEIEYNITLWVSDWEKNRALSGLTVTICDSENETIDSKLSNDTGYVFLTLTAGSYDILVNDEERFVGHQSINVEQSENFTIRTWAYDLRVTFLDKNDAPKKNN